MGVDEPVDEDFLEDVVEAKVLMMPQHGGGVKEIPTNYKFAGIEEGADTIAIRPYLEKMFSPFKAQFKARVEKYQGRPQEIMQYVSAEYEKPLTLRNLPYLSNHLSQQEGIIGIYLILNEDNMPAIQIRYCTDDLNADKLLELINLPVWKIKYKEDDIREENAKFHFKEKGEIIKLEK
jgi:hypothetical protein